MTTRITTNSREPDATDGGAALSPSGQGVRGTGVHPPGKSGLVIVDKPAGMTSHDVVARIRRLAGTRRVGHAGTLDPMATGVLVIGVDQATRLLGHLSLTAKEYEATIRLGQSTSTDDAEGEPTGGAPATDVTREALDAEIATLTGEIMQVPPGVSAIKVNGQRAYKLTRAGTAPEMKPRPVTVYAFTVTRVAQVLGGALAGGFVDVDATIRCSSGTYIRALARDLGGALGVGGHLTALRRTLVGAYDITQARTLDQLTERFQSIPLPQAAAAAFPIVKLTEAQAQRLAHGAQLPLRELQSDDGAREVFAAVAPDDPLAAFAPDDTLVALVTLESDRLRSLAVFRSPQPA
jgi:tRNA pseudouridine55 synthase